MRSEFLQVGQTLVGSFAKFSGRDPASQCLSSAFSSLEHGDQNQEKVSYLLAAPLSSTAELSTADTLPMSDFIKGLSQTF